ncbi:Aminomethyltransferase [Gimesia panareensis]|uniref:Aminomethyltransferase n=2 Tax=Gimesia panareensis TaxID=2527978 RepID=A0A518FZI5_9PLAN|nr:Aminomethyltransferase [Gimesia panareensis]
MKNEGAAPYSQHIRENQMPLNHFQLVQEAAGAHFPDKDHEYPYPSHYGDPRQEYQAAHQSAVLFDLSDREQIELTGADRHKFLHNFCTNDINSLAVDRGCEAFVTNVQSRILGHVNVFNQGESLWLDTDPKQSAYIYKHLDRYIILEAVELAVRSPEFGCLYLTGPQAGDIISKAGLETLEVNQQQRVSDSEAQLTVRRVDWFGQPGYLCCLLHEKIVETWQQLIDAGASPAGQEVLEALRIEACYPLCGVDLSNDNLAQEAGRDSQAISFKKGCYLGQEPIARIDSLGHVNQQLRIIALDHDWVPHPGSKVMFAVKDEMKEVGKITSAARSYGQHPIVALAVVRREANAPGTTVEVVSDNHAGDGTVLQSLE